MVRDLPHDLFSTAFIAEVQKFIWSSILVVYLLKQNCKSSILVVYLMKQNCRNQNYKNGEWIYMFVNIFSTPWWIPTYTIFYKNNITQTWIRMILNLSNLNLDNLKVTLPEIMCLKCFSKMFPAENRVWKLNLRRCYHQPTPKNGGFPRRFTPKMRLVIIIRIIFVKQCTYLDKIFVKLVYYVLWESGYTNDSEDTLI